MFGRSVLESVEMMIRNYKSTWRRWYGLTLLPLTVAASLALLEYSGWSAVYSAYYGLPSEAWRLKEAGPKAQFYGWLLFGLGLTATIIAIVFIPPFKSENLPGNLEAISRVVLALLLVIGSIVVVAYVLSAAGHYLE
jgi:hypothetical protein